MMFLRNLKIKKSHTRPFKNKGLFKVGDGSLAGTTQGPIINSKQLLRVERIVKESLSQGATCQLGGSTLGNCFLPTILTDVKGTTVYICQII